MQHDTSTRTGPQLGGGAVQDAEDVRPMKAEPRHLAGIVELARRTYGDSYCKREFYSVETLRDAIADGRMSSYVLATPDGHVVAHAALFIAPGVTDVVEGGAAMVHPDYRHRMIIGALLHFVEADRRTWPDWAPLMIICPVTSHVRTQRAAQALTPTALSVSKHDRANFVGIAEATTGGQPQRETLIHSVRVDRPIEPLRLYVPERHARLTGQLFSHASIPAEILPRRADLPAHTSLEVRVQPDFELATVTVTCPGQDLRAELERMLVSLEAGPVKTVYVRLPGGLPHPPTLEDDARSLGLFFNGWIAETTRHWWLQYARLLPQRFDFGEVHVLHPVGQELLAHVEACHRDTLA